MGKLFFSNCLEKLSNHLMGELGSESSLFFSPGIILVPSSWMRQWLQLQLAKASPSGGIAGYKIYSLQEGLKKLKCSASGFTEIFCAVFSALSEAQDPSVNEYCNGSVERKTELAYRLALLCLRYGEHGSEELFGQDHWQKKILKKLFVDGELRLAHQILGSGASNNLPIHYFGFDFLAEKLIDHFSNACFYFFSPCSEYWADVCTNQERNRLRRYWRQRGASEQKQAELDRYLQEAPPLLANWGRLGRETCRILDKLDWEIVEDYSLNREPKTNLEKLQDRLLSFSQKTEENLLPDSSIVASLAGCSRWQEVENLLRSVLDLMQTKGIKLSEMAVFAPDMQAYAPLVETIFSNLPYRIFGTQGRMKSPFYQGLHRLFDFALQGRHPADLATLLANTSFQKMVGWDDDTVEGLEKWLFSEINLEGLEDRLLDHALYFSSEKGSSLQKRHPGSLEQVGNWILLLEELKEDLSRLGQMLSLEDWVVFLRALQAKYFFIDRENEEDAAFASFFDQCMMEMLRTGKSYSKETLFPFSVIRKLLERPEASGQIHASQLHALRFASLEEGALTSARVVFLLGMDEESFPRRSVDSSLDLLHSSAKYVPSLGDRDRYWFLQALLGAKETLYISYCHLAPDDGREIAPSFLVKDLMRESPILQNISTSHIGKEGKLPPRLLWPSCPKEDLPEGEVVVSIKDLKLLARHPWSFYLQKQYGIHCEEPYQENFYNQRSKTLQGALHQPIEEVLQQMPFPGICKEALAIDWMELWRPMGAFLRAENISPEPISLCLSVQKQKKRERGWEFPALEIMVTERLCVKVVGEIENCCEKGFLSFKEPTLCGFLSIWPECLVALAALNVNQVFFLPSGKIKTIADPKFAISSFLKYYFLALSAPSPLLSKWSNFVFSEQNWDQRIKDRMEAKGAWSEDSVLDWVLSHTDLPKGELWEKGWGSSLKECFAPLLEIFPQKGEKS